MELDASAERRFVARVAVAGPDDCWPWQGTVTASGYGQLSVGGKYDGHSRRAHRVAYERANGPIPDGLVVCHRCDNPLCCNPAHLYAGTHADNQADKRQRGRAARGEANPGGGKLTEADVRSIRALLADGESKVSIGARFGVSRTEVHYIATRKHWRHVE